MCNESAESVKIARLDNEYFRIVVSGIGVLLRVVVVVQWWFDVQWVCGCSGGIEFSLFTHRCASEYNDADKQFFKTSNYFLLPSAIVVYLVETNNRIRFMCVLDDLKCSKELIRISQNKSHFLMVPMEKTRDMVVAGIPFLERSPQNAQTTTSNEGLAFSSELLSHSK